jgi:endonuclease/exonuclease/phosphatase (EEP) superfamily protein YafD
MVWSVALWLTLLAFAAWTAVRLLGFERGYPLMPLLSFTPYVAAASLLPLIAAVASRHWWHSAVAIVVTVALACCVLPRATPGADARGGAGAAGTAGSASTGLRVVTANVLFGRGDPDQVLAVIRDRSVDLLALQEITPAGEKALDAAGLAALLPYRVSHPEHGSGGSALYSRYPLTDGGLRRLEAGHTQAYATLIRPGTTPVLVESAHPCAPNSQETALQWAVEVAEQPAATPDGPVRLLLGDFNATLDHAGLRALIDTGYRDAAAVTGAGLRPTWPFALFRLPPVTIDHVLADRRIGVLAVAVHPIDGSDHRAVYAELVLPPAAGT